jgi:hypothetical protein
MRRAIEKKSSKGGGSSAREDRQTVRKFWPVCSFLSGSNCFNREINNVYTKGTLIERPGTVCGVEEPGVMATGMDQLKFSTKSRDI